jgi:hypothetical protein
MGIKITSQNSVFGGGILIPMISRFRKCTSGIFLWSHTQHTTTVSNFFSISKDRFQNLEIMGIENTPKKLMFVTLFST